MPAQKNYITTVRAFYNLAIRICARQRTRSIPSAKYVTLYFPMEWEMPPYPCDMGFPPSDHDRKRETHFHAVRCPVRRRRSETSVQLLLHGSFYLTNHIRCSLC